ncbi:MAG: autotransporter outer membrane beta-barrel domain-containing protein [Methylomonas sp.]
MQKPQRKTLQVAVGLLATMTAGQASAALDCFNSNQLATLEAFSGFLSRLTPVSVPNVPPVSPPPSVIPPNVTPPSVITPSTACDNSFAQSITPDQVFAMGSMATRVNGGKITQPSDYSRFRRQKPRQGGAGDDDFSRLGVWGKVDSDFGSQNQTFNQAGFDFDNHNFMFGADYRLQDNWVAGGSFAYRHNNASFNAGRGETVNDSYTGSLYTTYNITDALHVDALASYGGFSYETSRNITDFFGTGSSVAKASPNGAQYAFSWGGGYDFNYQALTIAPYARGDYSNLDIGSYTETGSIAAIHFGKQNIESLTSTLGVQTAYTFSFPWGVLIPQLRGEWHHQFSDGARQIQASFASDPAGEIFTLNGTGPSRDYYTVGAEVSSVLPGGVSAFLAYETLQGYTNINSNKLMLGARMEF